VFAFAGGLVDHGGRRNLVLVAGQKPFGGLERIFSGAFA
jgi:hypothetical protein